jgi:uncharacterized protein YicC (UPF0701 family)
MITPATLDGLLSVRGVVEIMDAADDEAEILRTRVSALALLNTALDSLVAMQQSEGAALASVLSERLEKISGLTQAADSCPARKPEAIRAPRAIACRGQQFRPAPSAPGRHSCWQPRPI